MKVWKYAAAAALFLAICCSAWLGLQWWQQRAWFALQHQQLATIQRLERYPPPGVDKHTWNEAIVIAHNVWGNTLFTSSYSNASHDEMRFLLSELERIVAKTTPSNSAESVDEVFELLLRRGQKREFIAPYREEVRQAVGSSAPDIAAESNDRE